MRRLLPDPAADVEIITSYTAHRPRPTDRPWVGICMVASLDGSTVVDHSSTGLSSAADQQVLSSLRRLADLIIVGAGTVRAEGYGPPRKPGQRIGVVSRTGSLDLDTPLFTSGSGFLIVPHDAPPLAVHTVRAGHGNVDLAEALAQLDVDFVQAEGGARLNGALVEADLVDELNLTWSPQLAGGDGPRLAVGSPPATRRMELVQLLEDDGFLFSRYVRSR